MAPSYRPRALLQRREEARLDQTKVEPGAASDINYSLRTSEVKLVESEVLEMVRKDIDIMPRQFGVTLMAGVLVGSTFWATLITLIVR
jgi:hypothetical protein